jgi:hypothetical protein
VRAQKSKNFLDNPSQNVSASTGFQLLSDGADSCGAAGQPVGYFTSASQTGLARDGLDGLDINVVSLAGRRPRAVIVDPLR